METPEGRHVHPKDEQVISHINEALADHEAALAGVEYDTLQRRADQNGGIDDDEVIRQLRQVGGKLIDNYIGDYARKVESDLL